MVTETAVGAPIANVLEAIQPFQADDGHKGTFLVLRIAGLEQGAALKVVNRKYRSWQNWRSTDADFCRIDTVIPDLNSQFGGEARVIRTALLDVTVIEAGISVVSRIIKKQPMTSDMWNFASRITGLRIPMMKAREESESPWEQMANAIKNTVKQRELTVSEAPNGTKSITAKEVIIQPSAEQRQVATDIVQKIIDNVGVN